MGVGASCLKARGAAFHEVFRERSPMSSALPSPSNSEAGPRSSRSEILTMLGTFLKTGLVVEQCFWCCLFQTPQAPMHILEDILVTPLNRVPRRSHVLEGPPNRPSRNLQMSRICVWGSATTEGRWMKLVLAQHGTGIIHSNLEPLPPHDVIQQVQTCGSGHRFLVTQC